MVGDSRMNIAGLPADGLDRARRGDRRRRGLMAAGPLHHRGRRRAPAGLAAARRRAGRGAPRSAAADHRPVPDPRRRHAAGRAPPGSTGSGVGVKSVTVLPAQPRARPALGAGRDAALRRRHRRGAGGDRLAPRHQVEDRRRIRCSAPGCWRGPNSRRLLIVGGGAVAASLVEAYRALFPAIAIAIWNRIAASAPGRWPAGPAPSRAADLARGGRRGRHRRHARPWRPSRCCAASGCGPASIST